MAKSSERKRRTRRPPTRARTAAEAPRPGESDGDAWLRTHGGKSAGDVGLEIDQEKFLGQDPRQPDLDQAARLRQLGDQARGDDAGPGGDAPGGDQADPGAHHAAADEGVVRTAALTLQKFGNILCRRLELTQISDGEAMEFGGAVGEFMATTFPEITLPPWLSTIAAISLVSLGIVLPRLDEFEAKQQAHTAAPEKAP